MLWCSLSGHKETVSFPIDRFSWKYGVQSLKIILIYLAWKKGKGKYQWNSWRIVFMDVWSKMSYPDHSMKFVFHQEYVHTRRNAIICISFNIYKRISKSTDDNHQTVIKTFLNNKIEYDSKCWSFTKDHLFQIIHQLSRASRTPNDHSLFCSNEKWSWTIECEWANRSLSFPSYIVCFSASTLLIVIQT